MTPVPLPLTVPKIRLDRRTILGIAILTVVFLAAFPFSGLPAYQGGWEVTDGLSNVAVNGQDHTLSGEHFVRDLDIDGDFDVRRTDRNDLEEVGLPGVAIEMSYPYYMQYSNGELVHSDRPVVIDHYSRVYGDTTYIYQQYAVGIDITMKTVADAWYIDLLDDVRLDYGWNFESLPVDVVVRANVAVTPWVPQGLWNENWTVVGGWAGIMSMSVADLEYGLVDEGATENFGHTISNLNSEGSALNMYVPASETTAGSVSFTDPAALQGVPASVDTEVGATLAAGAWYHPDLFGHWDALAVRNVYVRYTVRVDLLTVALLQPLATGHQEELSAPEEDNTAYVPQVPVLSDLLLWGENVFGAIASWFGSNWFVVVSLIVVFAVVVLVFLRRPL